MQLPQEKIPYAWFVNCYDFARFHIGFYWATFIIQFTYVYLSQRLWTKSVYKKLTVWEHLKDFIISSSNSHHLQLSPAVVHKIDTFNKGLWNPIQITYPLTYWLQSSWINFQIPRFSSPASYFGTQKSSSFPHWQVKKNIKVCLKDQIVGHSLVAELQLNLVNSIKMF